MDLPFTDQLVPWHYEQTSLFEPHVDLFGGVAETSASFIQLEPPNPGLFNLSQTPLPALQMQCNSVISPTDCDLTPIASEPEPKPRKRRDYKPRLGGRNLFGRSGYRKCHQCRFWRQTCKYENVNSKCALCTARGFDCSPKRYGPKNEAKLTLQRTGPRQFVCSSRPIRVKAIQRRKNKKPTTSTANVEDETQSKTPKSQIDEMVEGEDTHSGQLVLTLPRPMVLPSEEQLDEECFFHLLTKHRVYSELHVRHRHASIVEAPCGWGYIKFSLPLRSATLALASYSKNGHGASQTEHYIKSYKFYVGQAIDKKAYVEVAYAIGVIVELAILRDEPEESIIDHLLGMCYALKDLDDNPSRITRCELLFMERSWNTVLRIFYTRLYKRCQRGYQFIQMVENICGVLEWSQFILESNLQSHDDGNRSLVIRERVNTLETYVGYCFVRYLLRLNDILGDNPARRATDLLRRVLRQIIVLTPSLCLEVSQYIDQIAELSFVNFTTYTHLGGGLDSSWESGYQLSWYFTAILIESTLSPPSSETKNSAIGAARSLCWLSIFTSLNSWVEFRNVLLAGLILTKTQFPAENSWIKQRLKVLAMDIDGKQDPSTPRLVGTVASEILDEADKCADMRDIWTLKSDEGSLWECLLWLGSSILGWVCYAVA